MKKAILFFALALATISGVYAQKQTGGEKNLEVQFAPLGGNPVSISGIRFRMFNSATSAIRVGLFIGGTSEKSVVAADEDADTPELVDTDKTFDVTIRPGYEKHFAGTERLSPYIGGEILFNMHSETNIDESHNTFDDQVATATTTDGSTTFGLNVVAGTDFYFANSIYLGAEIGFGFAMTNNKDTEVEYEGYPDGVDAPDPEPNGSSSAWGPNVNGAIRLGWLFN
jgi:opacity protein-like surface antigen